MQVYNEPLLGLAFLVNFIEKAKQQISFKLNLSKNPNTYLYILVRLLR